jgi:hypothetical protein
VVLTMQVQFVNGKRSSWSAPLCQSFPLSRRPTIVFPTRIHPSPTSPA